MNARPLTSRRRSEDGSIYASSEAVMARSPQAKVPAEPPRTSNAQVRERWLEALDLSHATRRVTHHPIEPGVHVIIVPASYLLDRKMALVEVDILATMGQVPRLARGVRLGLESIEEFGLSLATDYREWMGDFGRQVADGRVRVMVFVDLAYLEAGLLDRLREAEVRVDFNSPLTFFHRGGLMDYANVLEAAAAMVFEGRALADAASRLAAEATARLQLYAQTFFRLSNFYPQCVWRIERDTFVMELAMPGKSVSLALPYWELRGGAAAAQRTVQAWRERIETLLREVAPYTRPGVPRTYAA